ncbi:hypothetical protein AMTRI_Chr08g204540 [Amborella trichopoda]
MMIRFCICTIFVLLILASTCKLIVSVHKSNQVFRQPNSLQPHRGRPKEFEVEKRKVPTGSNPLHNR